MTILRRWAWPGCKFLVFAVIAVSLVRLAFFAAEPPAPETRPTGKLQDPTVTVETGTITNGVDAEGSIRSVGATAVRSTASGTVNKLYVANGATVLAGAPVLDLRVETPVDGTTDDGAPLKPKVSFATVVAPADGKVSGLDLVEKQPVELGDVVAKVAPDAYRAAATLDAAQLYRLVTRPTEATVTIQDGPAPFTCTGLTLTSASADAGGALSDPAEDTSSGAGSSDGTRLECDVPAGVTVFPGLEATLSVAAGKSEGVMTLPVTAVRGTAGKGIVTVVTGKERAEREVELGLTDGERVEVKSGIGPTDRVLEFVPGKERPTDDDDQADGQAVLG